MRHGRPLLAFAATARTPDGQVLDRLDLMVDFIPVVHVPNSIPDVGEH
jgi:hypothetical protein